jgi:transposase
MQSVLRYHIAASEAIGGVPREILYERMKTAVIGEDGDGLVIYSRALLNRARHHGFEPRPAGYIELRVRSSVRSAIFARDFFLGTSLRNRGPQHPGSSLA